MLAAGLAWLAVPATSARDTPAADGASREITASVVSDLMPGERARVAAAVADSPLTEASPAVLELHATDPPRDWTRAAKSAGAPPLNSTIWRPVGLGATAAVAETGVPDEPGPAVSVQPASVATARRVETATRGCISRVPSDAEGAERCVCCGERQLLDSFGVASTANFSPVISAGVPPTVRGR